jgi:hypothetical protein
LTARLVTTAALPGAAVTGSTLTLIKTTLKIMAWTKAKILVTGAIVIACVATTTTLVIQHQPQLPKPQPVAPAATDFPKSSWNFAGFADPPSALVSMLWAQTKTDSKTFLASLTPAGKQKQEQQLKYTMRKTGKSEAEVFAESARRMDKTLGFQIRGKEIVSENQVLLHLYLQGNEIQIDARMIKTGNEWRLDDFVNEKRPAPNQHP